MSSEANPSPAVREILNRSAAPDPNHSRNPRNHFFFFKGLGNPGISAEVCMPEQSRISSESDRTGNVVVKTTKIKFNWKVFTLVSKNYVFRLTR